MCQRLHHLGASLLRTARGEHHLYWTVFCAADSTRSYFSDGSFCCRKRFLVLYYDLFFLLLGDTFGNETCHKQTRTGSFIYQKQVLYYTSDHTSQTGPMWSLNEWFTTNSANSQTERGLKWKHKSCPAPQCYLCTAVLCHSSMDPSRWCTRWRGALVPERVPGHRWTGPRLRRRTAGRRWWSFRSGGKARSSGLARTLEEEVKRQKAQSTN